MSGTEIYLFEAVKTAPDESSRGLNKRVSDSVHSFVMGYLSSRFNIEQSEISIVNKKAGKPYVDNLPIFFNISHSDKIAAAAFSSEEIGIDIEAVKPYRSRVAERYFTQNEQKYLQSASDEMERNCRFFEVWTAKEAFLKYIGCGLSGGFDFDTADIYGMKKELFSEKLGKAELVSKRMCIAAVDCVLSACKSNIESDLLISIQ